MVTGGAGFIASYLVDQLIKDHEIVVFDDLSTGSLANLSTHSGNPNLTFIKGTILDSNALRNALNGVNTVFHFAAQTDVRMSIEHPLHDFEVNVNGSLKLLESMRQMDISRLIFASSGGAVYGDALEMPTSENAPFRPISIYGAAKGAFEMYQSSYADLYSMEMASLRFGNIIGPRLKRGIIFDFYNKLRNDSSRLEVLGTGDQEKTYLYVTDAVSATLKVAENLKKGFMPVNVSSGEKTKVSTITKMVIQELGLKETKILYNGSRRGWPGDVITTDLDISLLKSMGWRRVVSTEDAIKLSITWLVIQYGSIK